MISKRNHRVFCAAMVLVASLVFGMASTAQATRLPFGAPLVDNVQIPTAYGDNVAGSPQLGYTYFNDGEGWTPNVTWDLLATGAPNLGLVGSIGSAFSPLVDVAYPPSAGAATVTMVLQAAAGYKVKLLDFQVANWNPTTITWESVQVLDSANNPLATATNVLVPNGAGILDQAGTFGATPFEDTKLTLIFTETSASPRAFWIAFDNIKFAEVQEVPEPSTLALSGLGLFGLMVLARQVPVRQSLTFKN
ncbi:MAG: PEP-CTERM sorting domain-containing protein [Planctomycetes bacterium]|nr:PEP-CTERM sorting domain-containing protein [Planctomycetota bacterium]